MHARSCLLHLPREHAPSARGKDGTVCGFEARVCSEHEANPQPLTQWVRKKRMTHLKLAWSKTKTQEKCDFFKRHRIFCYSLILF